MRLPAKLTLGSVMVVPSCCLAGRSALPWNRGRWIPWHAERSHGGKRWSQRSRPDWIRSPAKAGLGVGWRCLWLGVGHASTVRPDPFTPGAGENEAPAHEGRSRPVSGRLFGLFQDPAEVVGATVDDGDSHDAGHLVGMLPLSAIHDLGEQAAPGAQGNSAPRSCRGFHLASGRWSGWAGSCARRRTAGRSLADG